MNRALHSSISFIVPVILLMTGCATVAPGNKAHTDKFSHALDAMQSVDYQRAEGLLVSINEREPDHAGVWANLGIVLSHLEREQDAVQALEQAILLNPDLAAAHNELGILHRRAGRLAQAKQAYSNALAADPDYAIAHRNIGVLYDLYLASPDKALEHYQRYIDLDDSDDQVEAWIVELERRVQIREAHNNE